MRTLSYCRSWVAFAIAATLCLACSQRAPSDQRAAPEELLRGSVEFEVDGVRYRVPENVITSHGQVDPSGYSFNFVMSVPDLKPLVDKTTFTAVRGTVEIRAGIDIADPDSVLTAYLESHGKVKSEFVELPGDIKGYLVDQHTFEEMYLFERPDHSKLVWRCNPPMGTSRRFCSVVSSWGGRYRAAYYIPWDFRLNVPSVDARLSNIVMSEWAVPK